MSDNIHFEIQEEIYSTVMFLIALGRAAFVFPLSILSNHMHRSGWESSNISGHHQFTQSGVTMDPTNATMITTMIVIVLFSTIISTAGITVNLVVIAASFFIKGYMEDTSLSQLKLKLDARKNDYFRFFAEVIKFRLEYLDKNFSSARVLQGRVNLDQLGRPLEDNGDRPQSMKEHVYETGNGKNDDCVICLDEFKEKEPVVVISCQHLFHAYCIMKWFSENQSCPICRKSFPS
ncbi:cation/H+ exchanger, Cation/H+ exchanger, CPA1 family [Artemisia annua]|uniref:Cation/H+ exchanger, Cation/H+ exchanger, CPA1 family n=1 Tax=Artemisia annua TaxID=35608 RepID=A0A2U1NLS7_ARTAN|nr:cation/H+ exchanger, Cation/H+ exchanger, CPA1 family [Artemisia annua]